MKPQKPRRRKNRHKRQWKPTFLRELAKSRNVTAACEKASVSRHNAYLERDADQAFQAAWTDITEGDADCAEAELLHRGMNGTVIGYTGRGKARRAIKRKDTRALIAWLQANRKEKYGKRIDHFQHKYDLSTFSPDELQQVADGVHPSVVLAARRSAAEAPVVPSSPDSKPNPATLH